MGWNRKKFDKDKQGRDTMDPARRKRKTKQKRADAEQELVRQQKRQFFRS